ncbi:MAG: HAD-IIB family hydrolase [Porticoccaceae bacterium]
MSIIDKSPALIFTDLDGSLLDHDSYSFAHAALLLNHLEMEYIPVIPTTSKTFAEVERLRIKLNNHHPFIIENGAAIAIPINYFPSMPKGCYEKSGFWIVANSKPRHHWNTLLEENSQDFKGEFETFSSIYAAKGAKGIQEITGLSLDQAELSNQRDFSEPIHWVGSEPRKQAFIKKLTAAGGTLLQGGRFLALGGQVDKGSALLQLTKMYQQFNSFAEFHTLAIGDSGNDVSMLEAATSAIIIRSKTHAAPSLKRDKNLTKSTAFGPEGWAESVSFWLTDSLEIGSKNYG